MDLRRIRRHTLSPPHTHLPMHRHTCTDTHAHKRTCTLTHPTHTTRACTILTLSWCEVTEGSGVCEYNMLGWEHRGLSFPFGHCDRRKFPEPIVICVCGGEGVHMCFCVWYLCVVCYVSGCVLEMLCFVCSVCCGCMCRCGLLSDLVGYKWEPWCLKFWNVRCVNLWPA